MNCSHLFRCCFISALERNYFTEKWISDHTLVTIYKHDYTLDFASKRYINKYLPQLSFEGLYIHYETKRNIMKNYGKKGKVVFYFFTRHDEIPDRFVTIEAWQNVYENFRCLRSNRNKTNTPKRALQDVSNTDVQGNETEQPKLKKKNNILDIIGDYFTSSEARSLFNCRKDESAYDCLTRRIDIFDAILNNKDNIASIVNKATDDNCKLNENQLMTM